MSWYQTGFDNTPEATQKNNPDSDELSRFWVGVGKSREIVFLDDFSWRVEMHGQSHPVSPFCLYEHAIQIGDDWRNQKHVTCVRGHSPCKLCEAGYKRSFIGAMTILDITPWQNDKGETLVTPRRQLLIAPNIAIKTIEAKNSKKGNLKGLHYSVSRHDKKHSRCGSDFEFEEACDFDHPMFQRDGERMNLEPYGLTAEQALEYYKKLFTPPSYDEIETILKNPAAMDGQQSFGKSAPKASQTNMSTADETIPF